MTARKPVPQRPHFGPMSPSCRRTVPCTVSRDDGQLSELGSLVPASRVQLHKVKHAAAYAVDHMFAEL
jgi:hypothetical protein